MFLPFWLALMIGGYIFVRLFEVAHRTPSVKYACYIVMVIVTVCVLQIYLDLEGANRPSPSRVSLLGD